MVFPNNTTFLNLFVDITKDTTQLTDNIVKPLLSINLEKSE